MVQYAHSTWHGLADGRSLVGGNCLKNPYGSLGFIWLFQQEVCAFRKVVPEMFQADLSR